MRSALGVVLLAGVLPAFADDPHMSPMLLPTGCKACHAGHGSPRSPMLPQSQMEVCLSCHGPSVELDRIRTRQALAGTAKPQSLSTAMGEPFTHPLDDRAFSRHEPNVVVCTSCHSPHRGTIEADPGTIRIQFDSRATAIRGTRGTTRTRESSVLISGTARRSSRDPRQTEFEMCAACHGGVGPTSTSRFEVGQLVSARNRSYHPVEAPAASGSPSVVPELSGRRINCTDCHGNSDPTGAAGPHGSSVRYLLRAEYQTHDGSAESPATYALCYGCHDRERVLDSTLFPEHRLHVVTEQTSCATCHDPHGSPEQFALIRIGGPTATPGVMVSTRENRLAFDSVGPGSSSCTLTCHGHDHLGVVDPGAAEAAF